MLNRRKFITVAGAGVGSVSTLAALGAITTTDRGNKPAPQMPGPLRPPPQTPTPHVWTDNAITLA